MKIHSLRNLALGLSGLLAAGLLSQSAAGVDTQAFVKRDDTPDIVTVSDDDDDGFDARDTFSWTGTSRSGNTGGDRSRTGSRSGWDDSRSGRRVKDWTGDGTNTRKRDWSANHTNDGTRHNTR